MSRLSRNKILVRHLINIGAAANQKDLGYKMGYTNESYFSQILNEKAACPKDFLEKLKELEPRLNTDWLLTGEGEMLRQNIQQAGDNATQVQGTNNHVSSPRVLEMAMQEIAEQRKLVAKSQEQIDRLITLLERAK